MIDKDWIDITELVEEGNLKKLIVDLNRYVQEGCDKIYLDGYDGAIYVRKEKDEPDKQ